MYIEALDFNHSFVCWSMIWQKKNDILGGDLRYTHSRTTWPIIILKDKREEKKATCKFRIALAMFRFHQATKNDHFVIVVVVVVCVHFYVKFSLIYCYYSVFGNHAKENCIAISKSQMTTSLTRSLIWGFSVRNFDETKTITIFD